MGRKMTCLSGILYCTHTIARQPPVVAVGGGDEYRLDWGYQDAVIEDEVILFMDIRATVWSCSSGRGMQ